jgi:hypothetical protein
VVVLRLPGRYKVSPQFAGAIKAVPGVVEVQAVEGAALMKNLCVVSEIELTTRIATPGA